MECKISLIKGLKSLLQLIKGLCVVTHYPHISPSAVISSSTTIVSSNNIIMGDETSIGPNSRIMNSRAKFIMARYSFSGPELLVITGNHMPVIGKPLIKVTDSDKDTLDVNHEFDKNVVVEEDVWLGARVTLLSGAYVRRGTIVAAGAVVIGKTRPYSIYGGIPAKFIKFRWTIEEILKHESKIYPQQERLNKDELELMFSNKD